MDFVESSALFGSARRWLVGESKHIGGVGRVAGTESRGDNASLRLGNVPKHLDPSAKSDILGGENNMARRTVWCVRQAADKKEEKQSLRQK